ncbi:unnamed protein product [Camellia sinensis]
METQTQGKEQSPGKKKRGTSPSYPKHTTSTDHHHHQHHHGTTIQSKRNPNASVDGIGLPDDHKHNKHVATPSENLNSKRIPNYLRATKSSSLDSSSISNHIHGKKQASASNSNINNTMATQTQKPTPNLDRKRSFNKPPSPNSNINSTTATQTQKPTPYLDRRRSFDKPPSPNSNIINTTATETQKPTPYLDRRRSFDKPPSPNSLLQKANTFVNPTITMNERKLKSSSLSNATVQRTSSLPKPHHHHHQRQEKLKAPVHGEDVKKSHSSVVVNTRSPTMTSSSSNSSSSNVKKSTTGTYTGINKKQKNATPCSVTIVTATAASTKAPTAASSTTTGRFPEIDDNPLILLEECHQEEDQEYSFVTNDVEEDLVKFESKHIEFATDIIPRLLEKDHNNKEHVVDVSIVELAEPEKNQHEDVNNNIQPYELKGTISLEDQNALCLDVNMVEGEAEETSCRSSSSCIKNNHHKLGREVHDKDEIYSDKRNHPELKVEESFVTNLEGEETSAKGEKSLEEKENEETSAKEDKFLEEKEKKEKEEQQQIVNEEGSKTTQSKERDHQEEEDRDASHTVLVTSEGGIEETKGEATTELLKQGGQVKVQGKTNSHSHSQAYNDVIEETASKLREERKNKVKALVGAFETVISLQEDTP